MKEKLENKLDEEKTQLEKTYQDYCSNSQISVFSNTHLSFEEWKALTDLVEENYYLKLDEITQRRWFAYCKYDGKIFKTIIVKEILDPKVLDEELQYLVRKIDLYNLLDKGMPCRYCDKQMPYLEVAGYETYDCGVRLYTTICDSERCQKLCDPYFVSWGETRKEWGAYQEVEVWHTPEDVLELKRPFRKENFN